MTEVERGRVLHADWSISFVHEYYWINLYANYRKK